MDTPHFVLAALFGFGSLHRSLLDGNPVQARRLVNFHPCFFGGVFSDIAHQDSDGLPDVLFLGEIFSSIQKLAETYFITRRNFTFIFHFRL